MNLGIFRLKFLIRKCNFGVTLTSFCYNQQISSQWILRNQLKTEQDYHPLLQAIKDSKAIRQSKYQSIQQNIGQNSKNYSQYQISIFHSSSSTSNSSDIRRKALEVGFANELILMSAKAEGMLQNFLQLDRKKKFFFALTISFSLFYTFSIMQLQTIIAFGGQQLVLWNYMTNKNKVIWKQKKDKQSTEITSVIFGNNSNLLAAARDSIIILIEIKNAEPIKFSVIKKLKGHQDKIICLSILHDNSMIISGSRDKTIRFWSIKSLTNVQILQIFFENISEIKLSPNCIDMAVAMENGSIRLYKLMFPENIHDEKLDEINLKGEYIHCYKIFGRESLIFAHNCSLNENTEISQDGKSLERLFLQKKAKKVSIKK